MSTKIGILFVFMLFTASVIFAQTNEVKPPKTKQVVSPYMEKAQVDTRVMTNTEINESKGLPSDFPVYTKTGDKQADDVKYAEEKKIWVENNPEMYKQMFSQKQLTEAEKKERREKEEYLKKLNK